MSQTIRYISMVRALKKLEKMLPKYDPFGNYSFLQQTKIRGYKVFSHAEFETYFEDIVMEKLNLSSQIWTTTKKSTNVLLAIATFSEYKKDFDNFNDTVLKAIKNHRDIIKNNHGIKDSNLKNLFIPIGLDFSAISPTLLNSLNSFGGERGSIVHKSIAMTVTLDPRDENIKVINIINELAQFDLLVKSL